MANVTGSFTATGQSGSFLPIVASRSTTNPFNIVLNGTAVATVQLERSFDNGVTWVTINAGGSPLYQWNYNTASLANFSEQAEETEQGVFYRLNCTAYTSGTVNYRISQGLQS